MKIFPNASSIILPYRGILLDAYGVFWGGNATGPLSGAKEQMAACIEQGKIVGVLSNSSQLSSKEKAKLERHGIIEGKHYHFFVTSGDCAKKFFISETLPFPTPKKQVFVFGTGHSQFPNYFTLFEDTSYIETKNLDEADFIYLAVPHIEGKDQTDPKVFRPLVEQLRMIKTLPMVCANSDLFAHEGSPPQLVVRQGSIAKLYEEMGGDVFYTGKPASIAFEAAMQEFSRWGIEDPKEVLMIGDTPETDIRGAVNYGMASALVTRTGIMHERNSPLDQLPITDQPRYFIERLGT